MHKQEHIQDIDPELFINIVDNLHFLLANFNLDVKESVIIIEAIFNYEEFVRLCTELSNLLKNDTDKTPENGLKYIAIKEKMENLLPSILLEISAIRVDDITDLHLEGEFENLDDKFTSMILAIMTGQLTVDPYDWFENSDIISLDKFIPYIAQKLIKWKRMKLNPES